MIKFIKEYKTRTVTIMKNDKFVARVSLDELKELVDNETCNMDIEIELFDETNLNLNERISKEYENNKICSDDWIDLLNKADKEDSEIVEVLPGQIGFEI